MAVSVLLLNVAWRGAAMGGTGITVEGSRREAGVSSIKWKASAGAKQNWSSLDNLERRHVPGRGQSGSGGADPHPTPARTPSPLGRRTLWELLLHQRVLRLIRELQQVVEGLWVHSPGQPWGMQGTAGVTMAPNSLCGRDPEARGQGGSWLWVDESPGA